MRSRGRVILRRRRTPSARLAVLVPRRNHDERQIGTAAAQVSREAGCPVERALHDDEIGRRSSGRLSGRSDVDFDDRLRLDIEYIRKRGFWFDLKLLYLTAVAVVARKGAY